MNGELEMRLMERASALFPVTDCTDEAAVRHIKREWVKKVQSLRNGRGWVADGAVGWKIGQEREAA